MNETVRNLVEKTIEEKCYEVQELNFSDMTKAEKKEYDDICDKILNLHNELQGILSKEQWKLFIKYSDEANTLSSIEQRYMFNRGVKNGFTKLSYIKEELGDLALML